MSHEVRTRLAAMITLVLVALAQGCSAADDAESEGLVGAPETIGDSAQGVSGSLEVGSELVATANVNLRSTASTSGSILHVVPEGSTVVVQESSPSNGFYKIKHGGTVGWGYGAYYDVSSSSPGGGSGDDDSGDGDATSSPRQEAIARAKAGKGFSYWWGHGRFRPEGPTSSTKGSCSGSCPSCSHKGSYGGDCSGFAAKVWQVPAANDEMTVDDHPYSTASFDDDGSLWKTVSRSSLLAADAMVYRSGSAGHIFIYEKGDGWGSMFAYECKGCSYGCIAGYRTASSAYHGIRRKGY